MVPENIVSFSYCARGEGLSGSDRIFIELFRKLSAKFNITVYTTDEGLAMCRRNNLINVNYVVADLSKYKKIGGFWLHYIATIIYSIVNSGKIKIPKNTVVYSATDFWMDLLPAYIVKSKNSRVFWLSSLYLVAPSPFIGFRGNLTLPRPNNLLFYLSQLLAKRIIGRVSDAVVVTNYSIKEHLKKYMKKQQPVLVFRGAIDSDLHKKVKNLSKEYDAVFIGRLHEQKGVIELIKIWKLVCTTKNIARLAIIGNGPLEKKMRNLCDVLGISNNVVFLGFQDGLEKYSTIKKAKIVLHPEIYGVGSMAPLEAMICGLPCICFDLPDFRNYYGDAVIYSRPKDLQLFADNIIKLLDNDKFYNKMSLMAKNRAETMTWGKKAVEFSKFLFATCKNF